MELVLNVLLIAGLQFANGREYHFPISNWSRGSLEENALQTSSGNYPGNSMRQFNYQSDSIQWIDLIAGSRMDHGGVRGRTKRSAFCKATSILGDAGTVSGLGATIGGFVGPIGSAVGGAVGLIGGAIFGIVKSSQNEDGCDESKVIPDALNDVQTKLGDISDKIDDVGSNVQIGREENKINHRITQDLVQVSRQENDINFQINRGLINLGRVENNINFGINRALIQQGRQENLLNFARTQGLVNQGRVENEINFQKTQGLVNQGRVENFINFNETQGLINEGRHENLMNFALTQGLIDQGREENQANFAITRSLINRGREENQINFKVTKGLIHKGRRENLINFGITQDLITQGRWENLMNFKVIEGSVAELRDDTQKGFSFLSKQANRNLEAITIARLDVMQRFNSAYKLLDRNFNATNAGRVENLRNFEITKNLINQIGDTVIRNQAQAMAERMLFYTSTVNLIRESTNETISAIDDAKQTILRAIDKSRVEPILSKLTTFLEYFNGELEGIKSSNTKQILAKLQEPNGFLFYLAESRTPRGVNSLHSLLSDIINQGLAIPKNSEDEMALIALDALFTGTQTYVSVLAFLMEAYSFLADHYYKEMNVEQFHYHITLINVRYNDFKRSLNNGIIDQVADILLQVQRTGFVEREMLFSTRRNNLEALRKSIVNFDTTLKTLQTEPATIQRKPEFPSSKDNAVSHGPWKQGRTVSYAIQYKFNNILSKIGEFTKGFPLAEGMANPKIHVPSAPSGVTSRLIFRKFDKEKPEYVGTIAGNKPTYFQDIDKDLFNAAGSLNEDLSLLEVKSFLDSRASISAKFDDGMTALHKASATGNSRIVEKFIEAGADLNASDLLGHKPIHHAAETGYIETMRKLFSLGADVNSKTREDLTPLHMAALYGNGEVLEYLLTLKDIEANAVTKDNFIAFHLSVLAGHFSATRILADYDGVNVNAPDDNFFTPLHHAVATENKEILKLLLQSPRINVNAKASDDLTALHLAVASGNKEIVDMLLTQSNVNILSQSAGGYTALHMAAANGHSQVLQSLLNRLSTDSESINSLSAEKWTPLHLAISFKHVQTVTRLLLHSNIDIDVKAEGGLTPLHLAAGTDQAKVVSKLMLLEANLEEQSDLGLRALHYAVWYGRKNAASILLKEADVNAKAPFGLTPLHLAVIGNHVNVVEQLTASANIQIHSATESGSTALHFAAVSGNNAIVMHLLQHGAKVNAKDKFGMTAFDMAIENKQNSTSNLLKLHGGKSSIHMGTTALHEAAYYGRDEVIAELLNAGAKINQQKETVNGWAAIHIASLRGHRSTVTLLLERGADINLATLDKQTAIDVAENNGQEEITSFLKQRGGQAFDCIGLKNINKKDSKGWTPLQYAVHEGNREKIKTLLKCGATQDILELLPAGLDPKVEKKDVAIALNVAAANGNMPDVKALLEKGADVNFKSADGKTPLDLALDNGHYDVADVLIEYGGIQS
ncbi:unnamed protein product [Darwinula stevensoni]|uniref:Uncharacterized protein n=1 Tax=Darwinula stevensoni TaxID=69355 RepID=A0A7R8XDZ2_9CRUS|nr:unnamed protein product [Darwinula stevensoni]CAG0889062.1 unnamed protein product [Darwinula stevensoni]